MSGATRKAIEPRRLCAVLLLATVGAMGCGGNPVGTDGNVYAKVNDGAVASAAHDLACPREQINLVSATFIGDSVVLSETVHNTGRLYILEGCGRRVLYGYSCGFPECRYIMLSSLAVGPAPPLAPAGAPR